ncbi:MAG TPA: hypothetical protein PLJ35_20825 [Anaerolineae bacterium]|nr:hypothetical protein [Anaerolineae bacterium]HOR01266.1 hypothetical protein [Anaerolineae bacterium]HPL29353.1 hypothetical protein [Anaerolineae bacterium]
MRYDWLVGGALLAWLPPLYWLVKWCGPVPHPLRQALARGLLVGALFSCIFVLVGTSRQYDDLMVDHRVALLSWGIVHLAVLTVAGWRRPLAYCAILMTTTLWIECASTVLLLAVWSLAGFGYMP